MTETRLDPTTLRWAAQHIRTLSDPETEWEGWEEAIDAAAYLVSREAELAEAKREAEPGCTTLTQDELDAIRHVAEHGSNPSGYIIRLLNEHAELTAEIAELRAQLAEFT